MENKSGKNNLIGFIYLSLDFIKNTSWGSGCCKRIQITIWGERGREAELLGFYNQNIFIIYWQFGTLIEINGIILSSYA